jgi:hypothetical protein
LDQDPPVKGILSKILLRIIHIRDTYAYTYETQHGNTQLYI